MNEMFGTILIEMFGEPDIGKIYLEASQSKVRKTITQKKKELFSDKDSCIMIISGKEETLGKVVYMNLSMCMFLGVSPEDSKDYCLNDFVPKPFDLKHNKSLHRYTENSLNQYIFDGLELFLKDKDGFLVECTLNVECIGYELKPNFIIFFEPANVQAKEIALVDDDWFIYAHSKNFPRLIRQDKSKLEYSNLSEFFSKDYLDACESESLADKKIYRFKNYDFSNISIYSKKLHLGSSTIYFFNFVYKSLEVKIPELKPEKPNVYFLKDSEVIVKKSMLSENEIISKKLILSENDELANLKSTGNVEIPESVRISVSIKQDLLKTQKSLGLLKFIGAFSVTFT
jgi:uncharacterized ubiquitin-like protein YukD